MEYINKKGPADNPYIAGFNNQKVYLYAKSLAAAKQKAVEYFKPKKKQLGLIWVEYIGQPIDTASL